MRGSFQRVEHVRRTIRYEMEAPVQAKEVGIATAWVSSEFERLNGRPIQYDDDYWLEPMDEAVAFVFVVDERTTDGASMCDGQC